MAYINSQEDIHSPTFITSTYFELAALFDYIFYCVDYSKKEFRLSNKPIKGCNYGLPYDHNTNSEESSQHCQGSSEGSSDDFDSNTEFENSMI